MKRILVVDDDRNTREALAFLLTDAGYQVYEASDGHEALECLERLPIDLVLLDQAMPRKTGLQVMESLSLVASTVRTILITAQDSDMVRRQAEALHAAAFVVKPLTRKRLLGLLEKTLSQDPAGASFKGAQGVGPYSERGVILPEDI